MTWNYTTKKRRHAVRLGYDSGFELTIAQDLEARDVSFTYQKDKISYKVPAKKRSYTPDFKLSNGIIIESKGRFIAEDRRKHILIKEQHPELDIRFIFSNPDKKLKKGAKSTYADWCRKHGFKFAKKDIPDKWVKERKKK